MKLRKIYRVLFPKKYTDNEIFVNKLNTNPIIESFEKENDYFLATLLNKTKVYFRNQNHSDFDVFKQIFNSEEYKVLVSIIKNNYKFNFKETILIDAGANVGYTTVYFSKRFNFSKVFCIEPSESNLQILKKNIELINESSDIKILPNALCGERNLKFELDNNFRDGKDWSTTIKEKKEGRIEGITINEIMTSYNLETITVLKVDIEGAERFVFNEKCDLSFLDKTVIIALEIHDEFNIRESIYSILKKYSFILLESGELTIGINKKLLNV